MTETISFPPLRDLPPGRLEARKRHLLREIAVEPEQRRSWRGVLVAAVAVAALAGAGVAIAAGFGAFNGLSRVQAQTSPAVIDPQTMAAIQNACSGPLAPTDPAFYNPSCHFVLDTARLLTDSGPRGRVYVITDTRGDLCMVGGLNGCSPPLTRSRPITFGGGNEAPTTGGTFFAAGIAMDGVTSISFVPASGDGEYPTPVGKEVTVPVKDNIWVYQQTDSHADDGVCVVARFADGSTVNPFPEVPCP